MTIVSKQQLENAALDAVSIEEFANGAVDLGGTGIVTSRLGQTYKTLAKIVEDGEAAIAQVDSQAQASADAAALSAADAQQRANAAEVNRLVTDDNVDLTNADAVATAADRVQTGLDVTTSTEQAGIATSKAGEAAQSYADTIAIYGSAQAIQDAVSATAADRVQTGLDADATAADRLATGEDAIATASDRVQTGLDRVATGDDAIATASDRVQTGLDRVASGDDALATASDRVQTGLDQVTATEQAGIATTKATEANQSYLNTLAIFGDATAVQAAVDDSAASATESGLARDAAVAAQGLAEAARDTSLSIQSTVIAEGDTQVNRVITEGDTQAVRVIATGDSFISLYPYQRSEQFDIVEAGTTTGRRSILTPQVLGLVIDAIPLTFAQMSIDLNQPSNWDSISPDYTVAANRAGKDFCIYAVASGLIVSANATVPSGYTSTNSRKVGGFHCLCVNVGAISGHPLTGFLAGDILPASIWDLSHRPVSFPAGMVYSAAADIWVDIYLQSGTGASTASAYSGTITDTRDWMDFVDDLGAVSKRLLTDPEFQLIASGSNEETNITGSADPVTTGGHVDTAGRRMISAIGCEDCCGALWQWLQDQSYQYSTGGFAFYDLPGAKGSLYMQSTVGDVKLLAGGTWPDGSYCGARSRAAHRSRWNTIANIGSRGCARRQGA